MELTQYDTEIEIVRYDEINNREMIKDIEILCDDIWKDEVSTIIINGNPVYYKRAIKRNQEITNFILKREMRKYLLMMNFSEYNKNDDNLRVFIDEYLKRFGKMPTFTKEEWIQFRSQISRMNEHGINMDEVYNNDIDPRLSMIIAMEKKRKLKGEENGIRSSII
jgi:hypothetical protein